MRREEKGRGSGNPPSRHLWVGNLPHGIPEGELTDLFLRFGELESVACQPGRSYAFINFKHDEDAFAAIDSLQGFPLAGNPLRIEFAKADKSSTALRAEDQFHRDSRTHRESPDSFSKYRMSDKDAEPSEVLWIGFPAMLKVDEGILRKAFSPFGEIEKITVFPGRSYAFVQYRNLISAYRAKETLQGKLFGNPRVHICFAKSEPGSSHSERGPSRFSERLGSSDEYLHDRYSGAMSRDPSNRPSQFMADMDSGDLGRKGSMWSDGSNAYEKPKFGEKRSEHRLPQDMYELRGSSRERSPAFHDAPYRFPQKSLVYEEPWDLPEDPNSYQDPKRLKTGSLLPEKDLPEYPLVGLERERHAFSRGSADLPPHDVVDRNLRASYDDLHMVSHSQASSFIKRKRHTPEPACISLKDWKWEGTIAKGGNPICRARCFPVGKVMDMRLPEFLDCTARTGLDMLAKHYYQASNAWVVFFVPGSDADIVFYNEFMQYLEEKQRAAVAKLDDATTLFLVPPSDFSEKILKVPGKLSISGVVLRLDHPSSGFGSIQQPKERKEPNLIAYHGETSYPKPMGAFPDLGKPGITDTPFVANPLPMSASSASFPGSSAHAFQDVPPGSYHENRHDQLPHQRFGSNRPPHDPQYSVSTIGRADLQASLSNIDHTVQGQHSVIQERSLNHYPESKPSVPTTTNLSGLQPEQLVHLASTILGQQKQIGDRPNQPEGFPVQTNRVTPEFSATQFHQGQQIHQQIPEPPAQLEVSSVAPGSQNLHSSSTQEETDADPQKRLQATLQLAAALLQQIQQGKGT